MSFATPIMTGGQNPYAPQTIRAMNRTGNTLAIGDVVCLDFGAVATETQNLIGVGGETVGSLFEAMTSNVVQATAPPGSGVVAVVTHLLGGGGVDNSQVEFCIGGYCKAKVGGTNWSSAFSSAGVRLMIDTASSGDNRRLILATDGANHIVAACVENIAQDLGSANKQLTQVLLFGFGNLVGPVGA